MRPLRKPARTAIGRAGSLGFSGVQPGAGLWDPQMTQPSLSPPSLLPKACWEQPGFCPGGFSARLPFFKIGGEGPEVLKPS